MKFASAIAWLVEILYQSRNVPSARDEMPCAASCGDSKKPMCRQRFLDRSRVGEFANASSLYLALLALLGRWFPGPNFQANRLSVLAAICDKMQFGSLRWILQ